MSDSDNEFSDEEGFREEVGAFERVGPGGPFLGGKPKTRMEKAIMDPLDRFRQSVDAIARNLNSWDDVTISDTSIETMIEKAAQLTDVKHKNATAYVLGYLTTNGGTNLTREEFDRVIKHVLPHVEDASVLEPDIIRYSRLWLNLR